VVFSDIVSLTTTPEIKKAGLVIRLLAYCSI